MRVNPIGLGERVYGNGSRVIAKVIFNPHDFFPNGWDYYIEGGIHREHTYPSRLIEGLTEKNLMTPNLRYLKTAQEKKTEQYLLEAEAAKESRINDEYLEFYRIFDQKPEVMADEAYILTVIHEPSKLKKSLSFFSGNKPNPTKELVNARVLTQSSLTPGSEVYLTDSDFRNVYVVPANKLVESKLDAM